MWEESDNKPAVVGIGFATFMALFAIGGMMERIEYIPLVPFFLKLIGISVTGWFTYVYAFNEDNRKELKIKIENLYSEMTGASLTTSTGYKPSTKDMYSSSNDKDTYTF